MATWLLEIKVRAQERFFEKFTLYHPHPLYLMSSAMESTSHPEVVTYRLNGKMVYVPPAQSYEVSFDYQDFGLLMVNASLDSKHLTLHKRNLQTI
jgi:hypothetical protein